jgi:Membrane MotB of proton-channel complex MotA/MotB
MEKSRPILVIKKKSGHGGDHGGARKVAYADFVIAMMALFIVLWLLNLVAQFQQADRLRLAVISRIQPERRKKSVPTWWAREKILSSFATICPSSKSNCKWPSNRCRISKN